MKLDVVKLLSTFFGIGYLPFCPGTWASFAGLILYLLLRNYFLVYISATIVILIIGFMTSGKAAIRFGKIDPSFIVIDEVAAILILFIFVPKDLLSLVLAFFVFRALDILKPYPIKKIENFPGSWGIMFDDLVACFYSIGFIWLVNKLLLGGRSG
jgi:phosphatidylglycerophosphatase A